MKKQHLHLTLITLLLCTSKIIGTIALSIPLDDVNIILDHASYQNYLKKPRTSNAFVNAAIRGETEIFRSIFENTTDAKKIIGPEIGRAFVEAAANGHSDIVRLFIRHLPTTISQLSKDEAFISAAANGHLDVIKIFEFYASSPFFYTIILDKTNAVRKAIRNGHFEVVKQIISVNPAPSMEISKLLSYFDLNNLLCYATKHGRCDIVKLLLENGADINTLDKTQSTPLHIACKHSDTNTLEMLLASNNINVNTFDDEGLTPLHTACSNFNELCRILLEQRIEFNDGAVKLVQLLLEKNADINALTRETEFSVSHQQNITALDLALRVGRLDIAEVLRNAGGKCASELN